jgi:peptide/nickel transport system permease protein
VAESATVQVKALEFVAAARRAAAASGLIMRHHLLANVLGPDPGLSSAPQVSLSIILAAGLSFLGLGVTAAGRRVGADAQHACAHRSTSTPGCRRCPACAIFLTSMAFNLLSDGPARRAMEVRV